MITRPKTLTAAGLLSILSVGTQAKLLNWPHLITLRNDIAAQDRPALLLWASLLATSGMITADEAANVVEAVEAVDEFPDPEPKIMPTAMRSPDGAPGAWRVVPVTAGKVKLWWDNGRQPADEFETVAQASAFMSQWFIDNPAVPT